VFLTSTTPIRDRVDRQLAAGAAAQLVLLAVLAAGVDLGPLGWLAGTGYAVGLWTLLAGAARRAGSTTLGPADFVTLARAVLVGGVAGLVADRFTSSVTPVVTLVVLAAVALALDGVDGQVARRTRTVSALGARFDMEVDAFLVLVLSVQVAVVVTPWALVAGGMRYAFVAASWVLPWLRGALPTRFSAKVVAAAAGIVLLVAAAGVLPDVLAFALVLALLAAVTWSFGQSVAWLWRARRVSAPPVPVPRQRTAVRSVRGPQPERTTVR
jgi:phosphatidylglycerophosphate synthase